VLAAGMMAVLLGCQGGCGKADPQEAEVYRIAQKVVVKLSDGGEFPPQPERITRSAAGEYEVESYVTLPGESGLAGPFHWRVMVRRAKERWEIGTVSVRAPGQNSWEKVLDGWEAAP